MELLRHVSSRLRNSLPERPLDWWVVQWVWGTEHQHTIIPAAKTEPAHNFPRREKPLTTCRIMGRYNVNIKVKAYALESNSLLYDTFVSGKQRLRGLGKLRRKCGSRVAGSTGSVYPIRQREVSRQRTRMLEESFESPDRKRCPVFLSLLLLFGICFVGALEIPPSVHTHPYTHLGSCCQ